MILDDDLGLNLYIMSTIYHIVIILSDEILRKTNWLDLSQVFVGEVFTQTYILSLQLELWLENSSVENN